MYVLVVILLIVVVIFGVSSGMQSYATAQQAQAQIETAQAAQVASWGNLITIFTIMLVVLFVVVVIAAILWMIFQRSLHRTASRQPNTQALPREDRPQLTVNDLVQLEVLRTLKEMRGSSPSNLLSAPREEEPSEEPFSWLTK